MKVLGEKKKRKKIGPEKKERKNLRIGFSQVGKMY